MAESKENKPTDNWDKVKHAVTDDIHNEAEPDAIHQNIDTLLAEHKAAIDELRQLLGDQLPKTDAFPFYDDIWLLRYVLSFKTAAKALKPAQVTIEWRQGPQFAVFGPKCADQGAEWEKGEIVQTMLKYQVLL